MPTWKKEKPSIIQTKYFTELSMHNMRKISMSVQTMHTESCKPSMSLWTYHEQYRTVETNSTVT